MYIAFGSSMKSKKKAFDNAMNFIKTVDVKLKSVRLDKYYSESSYVSLFEKDTAVYVIPKKDATLNGSQKWKDTMREFVQNTMEYLEQYHQRSNSGVGFAADKKMLGWVRGGMTELTALYFAQACGTIYSTLTDSHAGILSHIPTKRLNT